MIELTVLSAVVVLFQAAFGGEDLDRKVGAQVLATVFNGLLKTTSPTDPVLLQIRDEVKQLTMAPYEQAMAAGHRYLEEARLAATTRGERLRLAREQLVVAAAAAEGLKVPLLRANAEFAVAKCDALLAAPEHAEMALRRAAAAIEQGIELLDVSSSRWRNLETARYQQDNSVGQWLTRLTDGGLINKRDLEAAQREAQERLASLKALTALYSEVQTAMLAASGHDNHVVWQPEADQISSAGLRDKTVITTNGAKPVSGFGLTLTVEQQVVWRPDGNLVADVLLRLNVQTDRSLYCRGWTDSHLSPATVDELAAQRRAADPTPWLLNKPEARTFTIAKGTYRGWLRVAADSQSIDIVNVRISGLQEGRLKPTGGCIRIPVGKVKSTLGLRRIL